MATTTITRKSCVWSAVTIITILYVLVCTLDSGQAGEDGAEQCGVFHLKHNSACDKETGMMVLRYDSRTKGASFDKTVKCAACVYNEATTDGRCKWNDYKKESLQLVMFKKRQDFACENMKDEIQEDHGCMDLDPVDPNDPYAERVFHLKNQGDCESKFEGWMVLHYGEMEECSSFKMNVKCNVCVFNEVTTNGLCRFGPKEVYDKLVTFQKMQDSYACKILDGTYPSYIIDDSSYEGLETLYHDESLRDRAPRRMPTAKK